MVSSAYKKYSTSHFKNQKVDKEITLLSQAIMYLSKAPVPDSAPSCSSLPSLQSDRCIFLGSFAAPVLQHREKRTVRSPLLSNTRSCHRSFLHCCGTGHSHQQLSPMAQGLVSVTGSKMLRLAVCKPAALSDVVQTK